MSASNKSVVPIQPDSGKAGAEQRLKQLGITLPAPPEPFGTYAEAVQTECCLQRGAARNLQDV
jgi:hypothetical protein